MAGNDAGFELVRKIAMKLPDVEESTVHGAPSWKLSGKLLTCPAIHKSAEPNSLLVKIDPTERAQLLSAEPDTFYVTDHYQKVSVVLIRLSKIDQKSLKALLKRHGSLWARAETAAAAAKTGKQKISDSLLPQSKA